MGVGSYEVEWLHSSRSIRFSRKGPTNCDEGTAMCIIYQPEFSLNIHPHPPSPTPTSTPTPTLRNLKIFLQVYIRWCRRVPLLENGTAGSILIIEHGFNFHLWNLKIKENQTIVGIEAQTEISLGISLRTM